MDLISFMLVVWMIKVLAEDAFTTVKGQSNPRIERRKARQKSRASNPIWNQFVGYLGDVAEDARSEQARRRQDKRDRQQRARDDAEVIEAQVVDDDVVDAEIVDDEPPAGTKPAPRHADLPATDCDLDICPVHGKGARRPEPDSTNPNPSTDGTTEPEEKTMADDTTTGEIYGLDACIAYCEALSNSFENHTAAGASGEQYTGMLTDSKVTGEALDTAHAMQEAIAMAVSAIESHKTEMEDQKAVQEAYDNNSDAGDKEFQQAGR